MNDRLIEPERLQEDRGIRPLSLDEYLGQKKGKEKIRIGIEAAKMRNEPLDHTILFGPPGLGKTTLAGIIAKEMGVNIKVTSGPVIERQGDLAAILTSLAPNDILFIDEIHRLNTTVEEILYPAMEDFRLDIMIGKGPSAKSVRLSLNKFTLIGATTMKGKISSPLRSRFGVELRLDYYTTSELSAIVKRSCLVQGLSIDEKGAKEIGKRARGTPRIANRLLRRVADYSMVHGNGKIDHKIAAEAMDFLEIDSMGLDALDKNLLLAIAQTFNGGPVGLETLAVAIGEDSETVMDVYEPYLIRHGFLMRTPRGRVVTQKVYDYYQLGENNG